MIVSNNLRFYYKNSENDKANAENEVLKGIDLNVKKGEFVAILGHNGSGKSTFASHINGMLLPCSGKIYVDDIDTADSDRIFDIRQRAGMVFQNPDNQIVASVVEEDVAFALENLGVPYAEMRKRVDDALKIVDMYDYRLHSASQLSGGQKQRVAIAGIIAMSPECIILDEPTAMLDPRGRKDIMKTLKRLNREKGVTIVLITHYMNEAVECDRVVVMDKGEIVIDDIPKKVFVEVEKLKSLGLDVPQATELVHQLKMAGVPIKTDVLNEDECVEVLYKLLGD